MTHAPRKAWLPVAAVSAVMASLLVFLCARTIGLGQADYFGNIAVIRHLRQVDAQWERDVLKSRVGIHTHYDALSNSLGQLHQLSEELDADMKAMPAGDDALHEAHTALTAAIQEKADLIERFKSGNSVLRNSVAFLPTAAQDILEAIRGADIRASQVQLADDISDLLLASVLFSNNPAPAKAAQLDADLQRVRRLLPVLAPALRERVDLFSTHVLTILREQGAVDTLLQNITAVPTGDRINALSGLMSQREQRAAIDSARYRTYLLVYSGVLAALLLYAALRLKRSHAEINRVNQALQGANEHLEQRVKERTQQLQLAQSELISTARQAGMAEIATNVLHNVGNVLNSVNVSAGLVGNTLRKSRAQGLARAMQLMEHHADDLGRFLTSDDKGRMLPGYLNGISQAVAQEQQDMLEELQHLTRSIDHIKDVVALQQSYAGGGSLVELVEIEKLVEDAVRMNGDALARHRLTVVKRYSPVPEMLLDRSHVMQILVNLIGNAKNAMHGAAHGAHRITLHVDIVGGQRLRVRVEDEGEGILAENLTRIFSHGFTTRQAGHGFGLHSCALAATQMGGTLTAHSAGPGKGATFTLELPVRTLAGEAANADGSSQHAVPRTRPELIE